MKTYARNERTGEMYEVPEESGAASQLVPCPVCGTITQRRDGKGHTAFKVHHSPESKGIGSPCPTSYEPTEKNPWPKPGAG